MLNAAVTAPGRARGALVAVTAALLALPLCSKGPLAGARLLGPRVHQVLDAFLVAGLAAGTAAGAGRLDWVSLAVLAATAVLVAALSLLTRYRPPDRGPAPLPQRRPAQATDAQRLVGAVARHLGGAVGRARGGPSRPT
ncbi:MAG TPA: hypothetical protein VKY15_02760 [Acidimicrobiales bacterium]|nr:hypothetical protein [Acidimicrobiales bacterium]